jgi:hypothetical protein
MLPKSSTRRPCREHEREWRGRCVDRGLEDEWLERLNGLHAFELISICEGHLVGRTDPHGSSPHIKLRLREGLLPQVSSHWDEHKLRVIDAVARLFQTGDTYVNIELKLRLRASAGRLNYQEDLVARVHRRQPRQSDGHDSDTWHWLDGAVSRVEQLDTLMMQLWYNPATRPDASAGAGLTADAETS